MSRGALSVLRKYAWPGNIRELRNVLELVCVLRAGKRVRVEDLPRALRVGAEIAAAGDHAVQHPSSVQVSLEQPLRRTVAQVIEAALALERGNRTRAAQRLGISTRTIERQLAAGS